MKGSVDGAYAHVGIVCSNARNHVDNWNHYTNIELTVYKITIIVIIAVKTLYMSCIQSMCSDDSWLHSLCVATHNLFLCMLYFIHTKNI